MKPGDKVVCPACNAEGFVKLKPILDGWNKIGEMLVCGMCEHKLCDYEPIRTEHAVAQPNAKTSALADLLGGVEVEKPIIAVTEAERRFCRDCRNFIIHPFMSRCTWHNREVNPMDDCPDFQKKD